MSNARPDPGVDGLLEELPRYYAPGLVAYGSMLLVLLGMGIGKHAPGPIFLASILLAMLMRHAYREEQKWRAEDDGR